MHMSNWLEEAENRKSLEEENANSEDSKKFKKKAIKENYEANKLLYDKFLDHLESLAKRVNDLPMEYRDSFGKINFRHKNSKLDNHLFYLSSSRRILKRRWKGILPYSKKDSFKYIRVGYFTISREMGMMDLELKEKKMRRTRIQDNKDKKRSRSKKSKNNRNKDYVFRIKMDILKDDTCMELIDWLAFKKEMEDISFVQL